MIKFGDLQLIPLGKDYLIIACDSAGGIGEKEGDVLKLEADIMAYYTAFVPFVEVLAIGGKIISVSDTLSVEMEPTGIKIIKGLKKAMVEAGLDPDTLTGSTEENMPTTMTGMGVTVVGLIDMERMERRLKATVGGDFNSGEDMLNGESPDRAGLSLLLVGIPKVGESFMKEEVFGAMGETLSLEVMEVLSKDEKIIDMIPVGSKGIGYEGEILAERLKGTLHLEKYVYNDKVIDYNQSAGPATCLIVAVEDGEAECFITKYKRLPVGRIGRILA